MSEVVSRSRPCYCPLDVIPSRLFNKVSVTIRRLILALINSSYMCNCATSTTETWRRTLTTYKNITGPSTIYLLRCWKEVVQLQGFCLLTIRSPSLTNSDVVLDLRVVQNDVLLPVHSDLCVHLGPARSQCSILYNWSCKSLKNARRTLYMLLIGSMSTKTQCSVSRLGGWPPALPARYVVFPDLTLQWPDYNININKLI